MKRLQDLLKQSAHRLEFQQHLLQHWMNYPLFSSSLHLSGSKPVMLSLIPPHNEQIVPQVMAKEYPQLMTEEMKMLLLFHLINY